MSDPALLVEIDRRPVIPALSGPPGYGFLADAVVIVDGAAAGFFLADFGFFASRLLRFCPLAMSLPPISRAFLGEAAEFFNAGAQHRKIRLVGARRRRPAALLDQRALVP